MSNESTFEIHGYFKEYYTPEGKYLGSSKSEMDREVFGYYGRKSETINEAVVLDNKKRIKPNTSVVTQLQRICGKLNR